MIGIAFDSPMSLLALTVLIPVIALFLLKRKRRDVPVSSSMLWQKALKETLARSPFRKPSEWLSLLLIVLAIVAAVLAASGTSLGSGGGDWKTVIIVVDTSASMSTKSDGQARIDIAREKAVETLEALKEGDRVTVITAGATPGVLAYATSDKSAVQQLLKGIKAEATGSDMQASIELAIAEAKGKGRIIVFSDFCSNESIWSELSSSVPAVTLVRCGVESNNTGIVHAAVAANEVGVSVLTRIAGKGKRTLSLYVNDKLTDAREIEVENNQVSVVFSFSRPSPDQNFQQIKLKLEPADDMTIDDMAHLAVRSTEPPKILHIGPPNPFIQRLEAAVPGLSVTNVSANSAWPSAYYDLAIVTENISKAPAAERELYFGCEPPNAGVRVQGDIAIPELADWDSSSKTLRGVSLENLLFVKALQLSIPDNAHALIRMREGPLLAKVRKANREVYVWACSMNDSNLTLRPAFPLLIRNLLGDSTYGVKGFTNACSENLLFKVPLSDAEMLELRIVQPDMQVRQIKVVSGEAYSSRGPHEIGFHSASIDGQLAAIIGTSLYSSAETTGTWHKPELLESERSEIVEAKSWSLEKPIWRLLAAIAAILLSVELALWMVKQRNR